MQESQFKNELIRQAQIKPGQQILDLGCGTATLTVMMKQAYPDAAVVGLDGDPVVLRIGQAKAEKAEGLPHSIMDWQVSCHTRMLSLIGCSPA